MIKIPNGSLKETGNANRAGIMMIGLIAVFCFSFTKGNNFAPDRNPHVSAYEKTEVKLTALNSMERIGLNQAPFGKSNVVIKGAKNEVVSFQVVVTAVGGNVQVIRAECSDLTGNSGRIEKENTTLYREEYVMVRESSPRAKLPPGLYPDPLVPLINPYAEESQKFPERGGKPVNGIPFTVWKGQNQPVWIDVSIPKTAGPGIYKGVLTFYIDNPPLQWGPDKEPLLSKSVSIPITLTVWNFTLPDGPTHSNSFGGVEGITRLFDVKPGSGEYRELEMRYCRMMAANRINPPVPASLLPEMNEDGSLKIIPERTQALKRFIEDLHVTDFSVPNEPMEDMTTANRQKAIRYYRELYQYLKDNGWDKRAYLYMLDEPNTKESYETIVALGAMIHEAAPQLRRLVVEQPYTQDPSWPDIDPSVDIWCPLWSFIDRGVINEKLAHGDEVWSYTALSQRSPTYHPHYDQVKNYDPPYWDIDNPLSSYRIPTWLNWQYKISGLLYWTTMARSVKDPWVLPVYIGSGRVYNGEGWLIYPGTACDVKGPVASVRLKNIRDGMQDYEYFAILKKLAGNDAATKFVSKIAPNWWSVNFNSGTILSVREEIANEIIRLQK